MIAYIKFSNKIVCRTRQWGRDGAWTVRGKLKTEGIVYRGVAKKPAVSSKNPRSPPKPAVSSKNPRGFFILGIAW